VESRENVDLTTVMLSGLRSGSLPREPWTFSAIGVFFDHAPRVLVVPQACELRMPEMVRIRPFQKLNLRHDLGPNPGAFLHLIGGQSLAPSRLVGLRQVDELTSADAGRLIWVGYRAD
jgi:hypothetical protein